MQYDRILIRYGELALKSRYVRNTFENQLRRNIKAACTQKKLSTTIHQLHGRLFVETNDITSVSKVLSHIFGIVSFSPVSTTSATLADLQEHLAAYARPQLNSKISFALRIKRSGTHDYTSQQAAEHLGAFLQKQTNASVDLTNPDKEFFIEIRDQQAYLFSEKIAGPGGLPYNTQGPVCILVTRPQSLLAAWFLMRRGCGIHFASTHATLIDLIKDFTKTWFIPANISTISNQQPLAQILTTTHCLGLITDHSLSEKKKSTIASLITLKKDLKVPVLSPLITMSADEIKTTMKKVGITT